MASMEPTPLEATEVRRTKLEGALELHTDGVVRKGLAVAKPTDVAIRDETDPIYPVPRGHPLHGSRALRIVPAGMGDSVIGADGRLAPATVEPVEPVEIDREVR